LEKQSAFRHFHSLENSLYPVMPGGALAYQAYANIKNEHYLNRWVGVFTAKLNHALT
jgi:hypothetical protein